MQTIAAAAAARPRATWDLRIRPAEARVCRYTCSVFPPDTPLYTDVPPAMMGTFKDTESKKHSDWGLAYIERFNVSYMVSAIEVCPSTNRLHYQFYFESNNRQLKVTTIRSWLLGYFQVREIAFSAQRSVANAEANTNYIRDPNKHLYGVLGEACIAGTPFVAGGSGSGNCPNLAEIIEGLRTGVLHLTDAALANPEVYSRHWKVMGLAEAQYIRRLARSSMCSIIYLWGQTGVGKSHFAFNNFGPEGGYYAHPELFYIYNSEDGKWWDDYQGQEYVIFNEYRGNLPLSFFLQLLDKWPVNVPRRNMAPYPFMAKYICITSAVPPRELYQNAFTDNDRLEQLTRRIGNGEVNIMSRMHMETIPHFPDVGLANNAPPPAAAP